MSDLTREVWERDHQHFESDWWGDCANTYGEETKQLAYAKVMGLDPGPWQAGNAWPAYDFAGRSVLDVGGGPVSMLLKCRDLEYGLVVDPCRYPDWVRARYEAHGVMYVERAAEDFFAQNDDPATITMGLFDEAWCYNVLQHTIDPAAIIAGMRRAARVVRVFEWIETEAYLGHPHVLHAAELAEWCGGEGRTVLLDELYQETDAGGPELGWRVEQQAWGGAFPTGL